MRFLSLTSVSTLLAFSVSLAHAADRPALPSTGTSPATASNPAKLPPISLTVRDATLEQLVAALNDALQPPQRIEARGLATGITLDAKDKPFWEIMVALAQQRPIYPLERSSTFIARPGDDVGTTVNRPGLDLATSATPTWPGPHAIDGPFLVNVPFVRVDRYPPGVGTGSGPDFLSVGLNIAVDPRIHVLTYRRPTVVKAVDDLGNDLLRPRLGDGPGRSAWEANIWKTGVTLNAPLNLGKRMSLSLDSDIVALTRQSTATLDDVAHHLNQDIPLGSGTVRVTQFEEKPHSITWRFEAKNLTVAPLLGSVHYTVTDSSSHHPLSRAEAIVNSSTPTGTASGENGIGTGPYKLQVEVIEDTLEIPIHVLIPDIPIESPASQPAPH